MDLLDEQLSEGMKNIEYKMEGSNIIFRSIKNKDGGNKNAI